MNHVLNNNKVSCFIQKHSVAKLLPTRQLTNVLSRLKFLNAITTFTPLTVLPFNYLQPTKSIFIEPVQGSNLNSRYISGFEPEMPVTTSKFLVVKSTMFPHRNIHKCPWTSPDRKTHNQIDHILIDRK